MTDTKTDVNTLLDDLCHYETRSVARKTLAAMGPDEVGKELLVFVQDKVGGENAIWAVIDVFSTWAWDGAKEALVDLMDKRPNLQGDILRALQKITGATHGYDVQSWRMEISGGGILEKIIGLFDDREALSKEIISSEGHDDYCVIKIPIEGGRKHKVSVMPLDYAFQIYSESGKIQQTQVDSVHAFAINYPDIVIKCEGAGELFNVTLTQEMPREKIDFAALKEAIINLGQVADYAEKHLTESDKI